MSSPQQKQKKSIARTDLEKAQVRATILAAARTIALEQGFAQLSIRKLADAIGYVPGTIYLYFRNRDELVRAICLSGFAPLYAEMQAVIAQHAPAERLPALLRAYANFAFHHPETYRLSFMEDPKFAQELLRAAPLEGETGAGRQAYLLLVAEVQELKDQGKLAAAEDTTVLADLLWTSVHGMVSIKLIYPAFPATAIDVLIAKLLQSVLGTHPANP